MIGRVVGNYEIVQRLGEGGMGAVYKAVDRMVEREVAVKVLRPELARQPEVLERFRSEAVTQAKLIHANIATLFSFFCDGGEYFIVMEFVPGRTLEHLIREGGPVPWQRALPILCQTLDGIGHAHQLGILHRDIKPANIMLTPSGGVKVADFGIARAVGAGRVTRTGYIVGTIGYMAPERIRGQEADHRSDLYSLGAVLFEMLAGRLPFDSDSEWEIMRAHIEDPVPPLGAELPPILDWVIKRAMAKKPEGRFPTAAEFRAAVQAIAPPDAPRPIPVGEPAVPPRGAVEPMPARQSVIGPLPAPVPPTPSPLAPTRLATPLEAAAAAVPPLKETRLAPGVGPALPATATVPILRRLGWKIYAAVAGLLLVIGAVIAVLAWPRSESQTTAGEPKAAPAAVSPQQPSQPVTTGGSTPIKLPEETPKPPFSQNPVAGLPELHAPSGGAAAKPPSKPKETSVDPERRRRALEALGRSDASKTESLNAEEEEKRQKARKALKR